MATEKPVRCVCGEESRVHLLDGRLHTVWCDRTQCWMGPVTISDKTAIAAWNKMMGVKRER